MQTWTFSFVDNTIPDTMDRQWFWGQVIKAMRYIEKASGNAVQFKPSPFGTLDTTAGHVRIGFDDLGDVTSRIGQQGRWSGVNSIAFDPNVKWGMNWFQRFFLGRQDMYVIAVHELGHLLGLPHNEKPGADSVMNPNPTWAQFSTDELEQLRRLA